MSLGPWQLIITIVILVLFGRGRISEMMGDFGKGIKSFKKGMAEEEEASECSSQRIEGPAGNAMETLGETVAETELSGRAKAGG